jgi:hypothetical protein
LYYFGNILLLHLDILHCDFDDETASLPEVACFMLSFSTSAADAVLLSSPETNIFPTFKTKSILSRTGVNKTPLRYTKI